jgi:uncharacterized RDD family membrane protein YckC
MPQSKIQGPELIGCMNMERFFAAQIDSVPSLVLVFIAAVKFGSFGPATSWTAVAVAYFGYFLISEAIFGNTLGKWSIGLCIRSLTGKKCTCWQAVIRSILRLVEVNPLVLGAIPAGVALYFSKRRQRLGDMLAGTVVVRRPC